MHSQVKIYDFYFTFTFLVPFLSASHEGTLVQSSVTDIGYYIRNRQVPTCTCAAEKFKLLREMYKWIVPFVILVQAYKFDIQIYFSDNKLKFIYFF
jgi:hypothetical protein